ncbi:MOSC N-terminal beta barrel domain-containing protein [Sulfitobacter sp. F26169L]|uniref:MOSC domain-containing protein n=1 Tax=Sulfitobacter sp. F26169L TaxID=2996015 RepID=UPI002260F57D|nr:MOSC N-terminal beta barrel domain-containing protein [Sulfitobacter sp. F26169L]MCX7566852.1 MOSC N-terminal beta barrel domain-containing protein [Sulfitobacter sp. F26169L]
MISVSALWRHPIKAHGREALERVTLTEGQSLPYDRLWAIAHDAAKTDGTEWAVCQNFSRGAKSPALMAISAKLDEATETITLRHPNQPEIKVQPDTDPEALLNWVRPLVDDSRAQPAQVFRLDGRGFTDTPYPSVSLCNSASHAAVEALAGAALQTERWRGNIWFDGSPAWAEFDWIGRQIKLGGARLEVIDPIVRCRATTASPDTGLRDVDTLGALKTLGHQNFGIYARVIETGRISLGNQLELV